jgi:hypothetical protein
VFFARSGSVILPEPPLAPGRFFPEIVVAIDPARAAGPLIEQRQKANGFLSGARRETSYQVLNLRPLLPENHLLPEF